MASQDAIDPVLVERFAHGNGTVFVGAGISLGARLPSWNKLMAPLRADLGPAVGPCTSYLDIAELYEVKHNRSVLVQFLKERLGDVRFQLTKTHELIVRLPVQRIYTTNFDTLLEQASQKKQINRNVIFNASQVGFSDTSTLSIVKLHGDLSDPASIVITTRDFYSYFARNPAVADLLKVELQTHTVLFMGYSFSDPNLGMILANSASQSGMVRPLLYSLQFKPSALTVKAMYARGVSVIPLDADPGTADAEQAVEEWLRRFRQSLISYERRKQNFPSESVKAHELPLASCRKHSVRRSSLLDRIKIGLYSDFRVIMVKGEAGIGKSQLVAEAMADCVHPPGTYMLDEAFEQIIWIRNADDGHLGHSLERIFDTIAAHADTPLNMELDRKSRIKENQARIDALLQERRLLIVIENFEDPAAILDCEGIGKKQCADFNEIRAWLENPGPYANPKSRIVVVSRSAIVAGFVVEVAKIDGEEALNLLHEHARYVLLKRNCPDFDENAAATVLRVAAGNPQAIKWALGLCNRRDGHQLLASLDLPAARDIGMVFDTLLRQLIPLIGAGARDIVTVMTVFPSGEWIRAELIECALGRGARNAKARECLRHDLVSCVQFGLLEYDARENAYLMHRTTREVLLRVIVTTEELDAARRRLAAYLLRFLRNVVRNPYITEVYWNALVRDEMSKIDPYWPTIEALMRWAGEQSRLASFALLLVHYMDSRFLNTQRLACIDNALRAQPPLRQRTRALLHIDALGWTYIEENRNGEARAEIDKGEALLAPGGDNDLRALAQAWRARLAISEGRTGEAHRKIASAYEYACSCETKYWIWARLEMMAGDIELMDGNPGAAKTHYTKSAAYADLYGGEGDGYQTNPRIGLALMAAAGKTKDEDASSLDTARRIFTKLVDNGNVATGRLYGQYGLALIAARADASREAIRQLEQIMREIRRRSTGNVLLGLAEKSYRQILQASQGVTE